MDNSNRFSRLIGFIIFATLFTGLAALLGAIFAFFNADWIGTGACLLAAAIAFGLTTNAILRS
jgi:uncharacterized membrane-anchored protein